MRLIYFDNASTSSPKAPTVGPCMEAYFRSGGYNIGRGHYAGAEETALGVLHCRRNMASFFGSSDYRRLIFTSNVTEALNLVLRGSLKPGMGVLASSVEHNAVTRPLCRLQKEGVRVKYLSCDAYGALDPDLIEASIEADTRLLVLTAASNLCGSTLPLKEASEICRRHGLLFVIDSAQAAGAMPLDIREIPADALCFTGHKSLLGPPGIGGVLMSERFAELCEPLITGGTGSFSDSEELPPSLPDRFEAGTQNLPAILALDAAVKWLSEEGSAKFLLHELRLTERFLAGIRAFPKLHILGYPAESSLPDIESLKEGVFPSSDWRPKRLPVVSIDFTGEDNAQIAYQLANTYGIMTRTGLHCAPRAHKTLGSYPQGAVRFSFGHQNTEAEVDICLDALSHILS